MKERVSRIRERGTVSTIPANGTERIEAIRAIVREKQYAMVDGIMVDLFSASAICSVYDGLNETNREKYAAMTAPVMANIAYKLLKNQAS